MEDYDFLFPKEGVRGPTQKARDDAKCLGPSHFVFRQYQTEKERVKVWQPQSCRRLWR